MTVTAHYNDRNILIRVCVCARARACVRACVRASVTSERDGKISELHNKVEQLHGTLLEMRHKNQTSEAEVQVHSSKAADMARRIHALEENKAKLVSPVAPLSRLRDLANCCVTKALEY